MHPEAGAYGSRRARFVDATILPGRAHRVRFWSTRAHASPRSGPDIHQTAPKAQDMTCKRTRFKDSVEKEEPE
jgi:hypothetical protein